VRRGKFGESLIFDWIMVRDTVISKTDQISGLSEIEIK
jgi:hypothetical protein